MALCLPLLQDGGTTPTDLKALPDALGKDAKVVQDVVSVKLIWVRQVLRLNSSGMMIH